MEHVAADDPRLCAVAMLDDFVAEIVRCAHARGLHVPSRLFDWATGEGSWAVERFTLHRWPGACHADAAMACELRAAVRAWVAPYLVMHFAVLREVVVALACKDGAGSPTDSAMWRHIPTRDPRDSTQPVLEERSK